jgi:hypothetical protein
MDKTEDLLRAALAATAEPADAGFSLEVATRIEATERRRWLLLALLMAVGAVLLAVMLTGLLSLGPLWALLGRQNWFVLSPTALDLLSMWASVVGVLGLAVVAFPWVRSRT